MPIEITAAKAGANILAHVAENRLVRINGLPGEWRPRQKWMDPVSLLEAIHPDIKGSGDCPVSLMPQWLASCSFELFNGLPKKDIYLFAERYGQLLAADAMAKADHALRDRWLVFVVKEALASARQIAITNKPYWRLAEASCELAITALAGRGSRDVAAKAAQAAQEAAQNAALDASHRVATAPAGSLWPVVPAQAEEHSAEAAKAAAETAGAAAEAGQLADADHRQVFWKPQWATIKAAEAARQAAQGWMVAAIAIGGRDQSEAEAAGEAALDAYFETANHPERLALVSAMAAEGSSPGIAYRRMFDRLLDEISAVKPEMTNQDDP
jgi:hypothetical protein